MKRYFSQLLGHSLSLLLALPLASLSTISCEESTDFQQPQLTLSTRSLQFPAEGGEQHISVQSNRPQWAAASPREGEWLQVQTEADRIRLRLLPNPTPLTRTTHLLVDAGLAVEKVSIEQAPNAQALDFDKGSIFLPQLKGSTLVNVPTGGADWNVTTKEPSDWLQLIAKRESLKLIATTNHSDQERSATLVLRIGQVEREVVVRQAGVSLFVLACNPGKPFSVHKVLEFERSRGSFFTEFGAPDPINGVVEESYFFRTTSPLFKDMVYVHNTKTGSAPRVYTRSLSREGIAAVRSAAFQEFARKNGYLRSERDSNLYINEREQHEMEVDIRDDLGSVVIFFHQIYKQVHDYPTFAQLDLGPLQLLNSPQQKLAQVEAYEKEQGSTLMGENSNEAGEKVVVAYQTKNAPLINRIYDFYTQDKEGQTPAELVGSVEQYRLYYSDVNLGLWLAGDEWRITQQFAALLQREGFEHLHNKGPFIVYGRRSDHLVLAIKAAQFADINNKRPALQISVLRKPSEFVQSQPAPKSSQR